MEKRFGFVMLLVSVWEATGACLITVKWFHIIELHSSGAEEDYHSFHQFICPPISMTGCYIPTVLSQYNTIQYNTIQWTHGYIMLSVLIRAEPHPEKFCDLNTQRLAAFITTFMFTRNTKLYTMNLFWEISTYRYHFNMSIFVVVLLYFEATPSPFFIWLQPEYLLETVLPDQSVSHSVGVCLGQFEYLGYLIYHFVKTVQTACYDPHI